MATAEIEAKRLTLPGHLDLPSEDGTVVQNAREHPQSILLTEAILPVIRRRHPDGRFVIGQDMGIYWRHTDPPLNGCKAPDWYYVPDVPATVDGDYRRSYVLWDDVIPPLLILEFASGDGSEERDTTPWKGKFWVYENAIRPAFYGIFVVETGAFEAYLLVGNQFVPAPLNERGHHVVPGLEVELGVWRGFYLNEDVPWLRWYDRDGRLLPIDSERADEATRIAAGERRRADEAARRAEALAARLRELGMDPDEVAGSA